MLLICLLQRVTEGDEMDNAAAEDEEDIEEDENEDWDEEEEEGTYGTYYILVSFLVSLWNFYLHCIAYN